MNRTPKSRFTKSHSSPLGSDAAKKSFKQPKPIIQTTTLWDFPSQHYGDQTQGDGQYAGVTPSYVIWNVIQRYTKPGDTVLDPMCGSGTTLDVCKDLGRVGVGFDLKANRSDIKVGDARNVPLANSSVDLIFLDPPYSNHIKYSGDKRCIGELDARAGGYFEAMEEVVAGLYRKLKDGGYFAMYIQDSFAKGKPFLPLGFEMFLRLSSLMDPVDIVSVVRHNATLKRNHWHTSAIEGNYMLRGFNYLLILRKNVRRDERLLKHESSGMLSKYFKDVALGHPEEVVTPETLASIILAEEKESLNVKKTSKNFEKNRESSEKYRATESKSNRKKTFKKKPNHNNR
jgi:DNA modification methylase